jgi:hypothetical protein
MLRRYSFIPVFFCWLAGIAWWGQRVESSTPRAGNTVAAAAESTAQPVQSSKRRELLELLDRIVVYEHYYRSVYGHFTKLLSRVGVSIPTSISDVYEIRVVEATSDRLMIQALSEVEGKTGDIITVSQDFQVHANFALPPPRPEYLRIHALKHLRTLRDAPSGQVIDESGVFRGFFSYEVKRDAQDRRSAIAVGIRPPVVGLQLEAGSQSDSHLALFDEEGEHAHSETMTGQRPVGNVMTTLEEAYLAQRIFRGEMGRYAKDWSELSRIAKFRFRDRERYPSEQVPFGDGSTDLVLDAAELLGPIRDLAGKPGASETPGPASGAPPLEIEPIEPAGR